MTQYPNSHEPWQMMPSPQSGSGSTAAVLLWILAAVQGLIFGCCSLVMGAFAAIPMEEWLKQPNIQQIDPQVLDSFHKIAGGMATLVFVIGCVPAVAYLIMGFLVKQHNRPAIYTCAVLLLLQTLVLGLLLLGGLAQSIPQGNVAALTMSLLIFGLPVGLQLAAGYHLRKALDQRPSHAPTDWDKPESWE
jgi:hypothetical protein